MQRQEEYENRIQDLTQKLKEVSEFIEIDSEVWNSILVLLYLSLSLSWTQAEHRAEFAEKAVMKLQKEVDRLEDEWAHEKDKYKAITDEMVRSLLIATSFIAYKLIFSYKPPL